MLTEGGYKKLASKPHLHSCEECRDTYDCNCDAPKVNGRCPSCVTGRRSRYAESRQPKPCCANSQLVTARIVWEAMSLAGPGPWFKCPTCARVHASARPITHTEREQS